MREHSFYKQNKEESEWRDFILKMKYKAKTFLPANIHKEHPKKLPVNVLLLITKKSSLSTRLPADWLPSFPELKKKEGKKKGEAVLRSSQKRAPHSDAEKKWRANKQKGGVEPGGRRHEWSVWSCDDITL